MRKAACTSLSSLLMFSHVYCKSFAGPGRALSTGRPLYLQLLTRCWLQWLSYRYSSMHVHTEFRDGTQSKMRLFVLVVRRCVGHSIWLNLLVYAPRTSQVNGSSELHSLYCWPFTDAAAMLMRVNRTMSNKKRKTYRSSFSELLKISICSC